MKCSIPDTLLTDTVPVILHALLFSVFSRKLVRKSDISVRASGIDTNHQHCFYSYSYLTLLLQPALLSCEHPMVYRRQVRVQTVPAVWKNAVQVKNKVVNEVDIEGTTETKGILTGTSDLWVSRRLVPC